MLNTDQSFNPEWLDYIRIEEDNTDLIDNWIEEYIMFVAKELQANETEEDVVYMLQICDIPNDDIFLIMQAGKLLFKEREFYNANL